MKETIPAPIQADPIDKDKYNFVAGLVSSYLFILASEIGDKTFIMVIIYTTKMSGWLVWLTASLALVSIHVASVLVGSLTQYFLSAFVLSIICAILFFLFGIALIYQGC